MSGDRETERQKELLRRLRDEAEGSGYSINPDEDMVLSLMEGLLTNEARYGYLACPCMEADGTRDEDLDIICPCDYRDEDLQEYGNCYCGLYVSGEVAKGEAAVKPIPQRRRAPEAVARADDGVAGSEGGGEALLSGGGLAVWRCRVCGYLCARNSPPEKCPICKVDKDRFELFASARGRQS